MSWKNLKEVNLVEAYLKEDFQGIVVDHYVPFGKFIQVWVDLQQFFVVLTVDFGAGTVVAGCYRGRPLAFVEHAYFL